MHAGMFSSFLYVFRDWRWFNVYSCLEIHILCCIPLFIWSITDLISFGSGELIKYCIKYPLMQLCWRIKFVMTLISSYIYKIISLSRERDPSDLLEILHSRLGIIRLHLVEMNHCHRLFRRNQNCHKSLLGDRQIVRQGDRQMDDHTRG